MVTGNLTKRIAVTAIAMASVFMVGAPAVAASPIAVLGTTVNGSIANVSVRNTSLLPAIGTVRVEANVNGTNTVRFTSVILLPGQRGVVSVNFGSTIVNLLSVGLADEGTPI